MRKMKKLLAVAGVIALLAPSAAFAQSGEEAYGGDNSVVAGLEEGNGGGGGGDNASPAPTQAEGGSLPFTGADLGVVGAAGGLLLALGFGLRRLTHRPFQA
jgi:hypothetical protein